jgi:hypothetical protein
MQSAFTASAFTGAVGESFKNGSTRIVLPPVSIDQALWPSQVMLVVIAISLSIRSGDPFSRDAKRSALAPIEYND